ncbi:hypothetical protein HDU85_007554 [Gaertneriomyces sp. JEL0708]|nr:hypothetical protein HDU85_007554 [Gaertneriomyces sp. JEL0708]
MDVIMLDADVMAAAGERLARQDSKVTLADQFRVRIEEVGKTNNVQVVFSEDMTKISLQGAPEAVQQMHAETKEKYEQRFKPYMRNIMAGQNGTSATIQRSGASTSDSVNQYSKLCFVRDDVKRALVASTEALDQVVADVQTIAQAFNVDLICVLDVGVIHIVGSTERSLFNATNEVHTYLNEDLRLRLKLPPPQSPISQFGLPTHFQSPTSPIGYHTTGNLPLPTSTYGAMLGRNGPYAGFPSTVPAFPGFTSPIGSFGMPAGQGPEHSAAAFRQPNGFPSY